MSENKNNNVDGSEEARDPPADKHAEIVIRSLARDDMEAVIVLLKENMSDFAPHAAEHEFIWNEYTSQKKMFGVVATIDALVVGYGSLLIETKIRGGRVGHMEDIVSSAAHRGLGVGRKIMDHLLDLAKAVKCYKVSLACQPHNTGFYELTGYGTDGLSMSQLLVK